MKQAYLGAQWVWPAEGHIRPDQEMKGVEKRLDLGLTTREEETAMVTGGDYYQKAEHRKVEAEREKAVAEISESDQEETTNESV